MLPSDPHGKSATRPPATALNGVALALGGGFARGFAHLGVLQVLEQHHIPIAAIAGTSVGSLLGAVYASGASLARIISLCRTVRFRDFARWHFTRLGITSSQRLGDLIERLVPARSFDELLIPFAAVATDLNSGEPVVLRHGLLANAVCASCAFPGLFEPVRIGTRCLVDGGLVSPVPAREARALGARCVVGISKGLPDGRPGDPTNIFQVVTRAVSAIQKNQNETWEKQADLVLRPEVQHLAWDDFVRAEEAMEAGAEAARRALPRIQQVLSGPAGGASLASLGMEETSGCPWLAEAIR